MDSKINKSNFRNIKIINEHISGVHSLLQLFDGRLASCSNDKTIKIYNMKNNYHCDITITGHTECITYIDQLNDGKLLSCSYDQSIKIWTLFTTSFKCDYTIENAHNGWINKVISLTNNRFASCSWDKTIKIWNNNHPYNLIRRLHGHTIFITSIIQLKNKEVLISGAFDDILLVWNLLSYQCITIIKK